MSGKGSGRLSIAGLLAYRPGHRPHLYYRQVTHRGRKNERRSLSEADYAALLRAAHHQLHAPIILIWDNLNTHVSKRMQKFVAAHADWLTVVRLPAYAPELNATEGVWSHLKRGLGNCAATGIDQLAAPGEDPAQAAAVPPGTPRRIPRPDRTHPRANPAMINADPDLSTSVARARGWGYCYFPVCFGWAMKNSYMASLASGPSGSVKMLPGVPPDQACPIPATL